MHEAQPQLTPEDPERCAGKFAPNFLWILFLLIRFPRSRTGFPICIDGRCGGGAIAAAVARKAQRKAATRPGCQPGYRVAGALDADGRAPAFTTTFVPIFTRV